MQPHAYALYLSILNSDLREVQISSVEEAFRILTYGRRNRRMAATRQNKDSSRRCACKLLC